MTSARDKGLKLFGEIYGPDMARGIEATINAADRFGAEQSRWTLEFGYGEVWSRDGLERKMRSCVVLGILMGLRQHDEIKYHTKMAIKNGLTRQELEEVFYTAIPYAGFPAASTAKKAMLEAFEELDGETVASA